MPEFESINEALIACVKVLGGSKQVGHRLWPEKAVDAAQRHLLACLNDDKPERLSPEQLVLLMRMSREQGCHAVMNFLADSLGYSQPTPIDPRDEMTELLRQYLQRREVDAKKDERLERMIAAHLSPRAAA